MAELGESGNPRDLIPGDPAAVDGNVDAIRNRGQAMEQAGADLKKIDSDAWRGAAGDAFRENFTYEPARWHQAADAFQATANALESYVSTLRWAQSEAREAIHLWDQGEEATRAATAKHEAAVADAEAQNRAYAAASDPTIVHPPPFSDPGEAKRQAARERLQRARNQLAEAGDRNAATIRARGDEAPQKSLLDDIGDIAGTVGDFIGDFAEGAWDAISGTAEFLWDISPHHLITDPENYGQTWNQLGQTITSAASDPVEFGKQLIGWEHWKNGDPGRALGQITGGAVLGYGAGKAASALGKMRKASRASKIRPNLRDYFDAGSKPTASELDEWAQAQGWEKRQTPTGPPKYFDENGVERLAIKQGSDRTPGSESPHVAIRDENGQRIDPFGNPVTRRDPGNHTAIDWDW